MTEKYPPPLKTHKAFRTFMFILICLLQQTGVVDPDPDPDPVFLGHPDPDSDPGKSRIRILYPQKKPHVIQIFSL